MLFPEPDGPVSENSPGSTCSDTSSSAEIRPPEALADVLQDDLGAAHFGVTGYVTVTEPFGVFATTRNVSVNPRASAGHST